MTTKTKKSVSRRNFLILGSAAVGTAAIAGTTYSILNQHQNGVPGAEPQRLVSKNGILDINLVAAVTKKVIDGKTVNVLTYNGQTPGPTWVAKPGDEVHVAFTNKLGESTNLHTHGLHVSPEGNSDNPFIEIRDGETFKYKYQVPHTHKEGTFWYHPHHHGMAAKQVFGGLYGAIIIENEQTPQVEADRVLVISDIAFSNDGNIAGVNAMSKMMGREGSLLLVNGGIQPEMQAKSGAIERWRIVNACTSRNLDLTVLGAAAKILGLDGNKYSELRDLNRVTIAPGNRLELLVTLSNRTASLNYTTVPHPDAMGMMGSSQTYADYPLLTVKPNSQVASVTSAAAVFTSPLDLRKETVMVKRTFKLWMPGMNNMMSMMGSGIEGQFKINGQAFDMNRIDTVTSKGSVEEWTLVNESTMNHPFHLHVWDQQILSTPVGIVADVEYQDVVNVPAKSQVVVRVKFDDFSGMSVYHCHILDHEDLGMMGIINAI